MMVLCILLAMLSLFLSLKLIYQRKLVQKVKKQIDFLIDRDTQTEIMVEKTDGTIQDLAASINHLLKKYRSMGQEIERSDTLFRDTITSLSHDLRTPLATANGYIQLLQEQDLTGEQKEYATIAGERISAVKLLLDQLFEFVRIEADELKLNCRNTDIHSVLRDVVASYYGDFEQKKCVPYIVIPNPPAIIWGDPDALTRIFSNVVYNALVHGEGNYQITAAIEEAQTVITIKNASSSIQQEDIPHLFDRFYTTDQSRTKKTTGLGLAIAQRLVTRMGGQHCILVSSHNLTEIAAVTDVLIFIRGGKIIKIVKNDYNEKELEAVTYERETKSVAFQGKIIVLESLTPVLPPKEKAQRKKEIERCLYEVFRKYGDRFP